MSKRARGDQRETRASTLPEPNSRCAAASSVGCPVSTPLKLIVFHTQVLLGDATIGQALIAVMSESYVEFAKAVWKLNKSYKVRALSDSGSVDLELNWRVLPAQVFMSVHKIVFPDDIGEDESLRQVFTKLNQHYLNQTTQQAAAPAASGSSGLFGWGRSKKNPVLNRVRHSSSSSDLPSLSSSSSPAGIGADGNSVPASEPVSNAPSPNDSTTDLAAGVDRLQVGRTTTAVFMEADEDDFPTPLWANDPLTTLIISGAALGSGLFGLIFSSTNLLSFFLRLRLYPS